MPTHKLKTWPQYFKDTQEGKKTFELRKHDRDFKVGDKLQLLEYDPLTVDKNNVYSGKKQKVKVTYIIDGDTDDGFKFGLQRGYVIMGIQKL